MAHVAVYIARYESRMGQGKRKVQDLTINRQGVQLRLGCTPGFLEIRSNPCLLVAETMFHRA